MAFGVDDVINEALKLVNKFVPDKSEQERIKAEVEKAKAAGDFSELKAMLEADAAQIEVNKVEAASPSMFVSGWRPAVGWVCVFALGAYYIPRFALGMSFWCRLAWNSHDALPPMPEMGIAEILGLVATLLGSSAIRMREKQLNVARAR